MNINYPKVLGMIDALIEITPEEQHEVHRDFYRTLIEIIKNHHTEAKKFGVQNFEIGYVEQSMLTILSGSIIASYEGEAAIRKIMASTEELMNMSIRAAKIDYQNIENIENTEVN